MELSDLVEKTLAKRRGRRDPLRIVQSGHPALRARARDWEGQLEEDLLADLVEAMTLTMRGAPGVGLAAPQVGIPLRLAVLEDPVAAPGGDADPGTGAADPEQEVDPEDALLDRRPLPLHVLLNPEYEAAGADRVLFWEGCLSVDGWQSIVPRAAEVTWTALQRDDDGVISPASGRWTGWSARILQHETDHLAGTLCHDLGIPRSFVAAPYAARYADLTQAARRLGLTGEIEDLAPGQVRLSGDTLPTERGA